MCRPWRIPALASPLLVLLLVARPAAAQEAATADQLKAQLEALRPRIEARLEERRREQVEARARERARPAARTVTSAPAPPLPATLAAWLGGAAQINRTVPSADLYRRLLVDPAEPVRRCGSGQAEACVMALGLSATAGPGAGATQWYDESAVRRVVWAGANGSKEWNRSDVQACLERGEQACFQVLDRWGFARAAPITMAARVSLARFALARGGEGARDRMAALGDEAGVAALLAAASGTPIPELVPQWTARLKQSHPRHDGSHERRDRGTALAWASLFAFLAMTNTRWRVGR